MEVFRAYLDTNTFLHFRQFDQIDWCKLLKAKKVVLIVSPVVIKELDMKKYLAPEAKIRNRARTAIKKLEEIGLGTKKASIRHNVELVFISREPKIDWDSEGLISDISDDRIIATILNENPEIKNNILLITADLGLKLKANQKGINCFTLPDGLRLPISTQEDKLRSRLAKLESRIPNLSLKPMGEEEFSKPLKFTLKRIPALKKSEIEKGLEQIRKNLEYPEPKKEKAKSITLALEGFSFPSKDEIERYKRDVGKYTSQYRQYLVDEWKYKEFYSRTIKILLSLINDGSCPAEGIDIYLWFPPDLELSDTENMRSCPEPPELPEPPQTIHEKFTSSPYYTRRLSDILLKPTPINYDLFKKIDSPSGPIIKKEENDYEVLYSVPKLKHNFTFNLDPVFITFSDINKVFSFSIKYEILADNMPEFSKGSIDIIVDVKD